jgi:hypothetical protein
VNTSGAGYHILLFSLELHIQSTTINALDVLHFNPNMLQKLLLECCSKGDLLTSFSAMALTLTAITASLMLEQDRGQL